MLSEANISSPGSDDIHKRMDSTALAYANRLEIYTAAAEVYIRSPNDDAGTSDASPTPTFNEDQPEHADLPDSQDLVLPSGVDIETCWDPELVLKLRDIETRLQLACASDCMVNIQVEVNVLSKISDYVRTVYGHNDRNPNGVLRAAMERSIVRIRRNTERYQSSYKALRTLWPERPWTRWFKHMDQDRFNAAANQLLDERFEAVHNLCVMYSWVWSFEDYRFRIVDEEVKESECRWHTIVYVTCTENFNEGIRLEFVFSLAKVERIEEEVALTYVEMQRASKWFRRCERLAISEDPDSHSRPTDVLEAIVKRRFYTRIRQRLEHEWSQVLKGNTIFPIPSSWRE